jgi:phage shock protein PspC (stress-responsive transcriptional regulator)
MDKTININLGGTLFSIDEEAYRILHEYLNSINLKFRNVPGGNETIEDIESRIAEIFLTQKGNAGVITRDNVESMIKTIGKPEDFDQQENEAPQHEQAHHGGRKMYRNPDDLILGGICGGIGTNLNTDPVWIRILFVIFTLFFGLGLFIYLALWIVLPMADTDARKTEMYGSANFMQVSGGAGAKPKYQTTSRIGNAFNEIFRALGKVLYIIVRALLIAFGVAVVLSGFLAILAFVMVTVFKYPGAFSTDITGVNLSYIPDFLNYIISPNLVPWVKGLMALVVSLPLLALIYGGIRLIFWFRARDGYVWLAGFVIWVMCIAALSIILFNEGIGFSETGKISSREYFKAVPDTLYIKAGRRIEDIKVDKEIILPDEGHYVFYVSDEKKEIYFRTRLNIDTDEGNSASYEISKRSAGRSRLDAQRKCGKLQYNASISGKTLYLDEFFTLPSDLKWSFDFVSVRVRVPEGTVIYMDETVEGLFRSHEDYDFAADPKERFWEMTGDGLEHIESRKRN